jgi:hypothetical protein
MSFDKGAVNFSVLRTTSKIDIGFASDLVQDAYKDVPITSEDTVIDLSSGISLQPPNGRPVTQDDFLRDSIPYLAVRKRELKVDSSVMKEIISRMIEEKKQSGIPISRKVIKEIKTAVKQQLSVNAPVKTTGVRAVFSPTGFCFVEASTVKKALSFAEDLSSMVPMSKLGSLNLVDFNYIAAALQYDVGSYIPMKFSPHEVISGLGEDFLTFILVAANGGYILPEDVQLSTPGLIEMTDCSTSNAGSKIALLKEGIPCAGREMSSCIGSGKKVSALDIAVQFKDAAFTATVDLNFGVKKFTAVKGDEEEKEETFMDRVVSMDTFVMGMTSLFSFFLERIKKESVAVQSAVSAWAEHI